jgi:wyosine [tRNA(Phe)-imidazoG37] synthetase (radical SAM superfamily)
MMKNRLKIGRSGYGYYDNLIEHLGTDATAVIFGKDFYWPRQFEIHLPSDHKTSCNLHCKWCQGSLYDKQLGVWELKGLDLLDKLKGAIPYHIYSGVYTEPTMNPYLLSYLATTKKHNNCFGIHTNGTKLLALENAVGFLTELDRLTDSEEDYLSISLDGGSAQSWAKTKSSAPYMFNDIIEGISKIAKIRSESKGAYAIRVCYLMNEENDSDENISSIVNTMKGLGVDSIRFAIPYAKYNQPFDIVAEHKSTVEDVSKDVYAEKLKPYLSSDTTDKPYVFYVGSDQTSVDNYTFNRCIYHAYQITYGADGYAYRCCAVAAPDAKHCRLGVITDDLDKFKAMINKNRNEFWDCKKMCFDRGLRCARMAIELNQEYKRLVGRGK